MPDKTDGLFRTPCTCDLCIFTRSFEQIRISWQNAHLAYESILNGSEELEGNLYYLRDAVDRALTGSRFTRSARLRQLAYDLEAVKDSMKRSRERRQESR